MEPKVSVNSGDHLFSQLYSFCIDQVNILIRIKVENKTTEFIQAGSTDLHPTVLHWAIFWQLYLSNLTNLFFQICYKCGNTKFLTDNIWKWKSCPFNQFLNTAKRALQPKQISWMTLVWFFVFSLFPIERQWLDFSRFSSPLEKILGAGKYFKVWLGRDYSGCRRLFVSCLDSLSLLITSDFGFKFSLKHSQTLHCILRRWWECNYQMSYRQLVI